MKKSLYIAGPLFNIHERRYLEEITSKLEGHGYQCFLPHRDQSGINESELDKTEMSKATKNKIFNNDLDALKKSDITIALISGSDIDSGTAGEIGFTFASGKPVIAIDASERRYRNLFVGGMIIQTVNDVDDIVPAIEKVIRKKENL